jgi:hypothetical protein
MAAAKAEFAGLIDPRLSECLRTILRSVGGALASLLPPDVDAKVAAALLREGEPTLVFALPENLARISARLILAPGMTIGAGASLRASAAETLEDEAFRKLPPRLRPAAIVLDAVLVAGFMAKALTRSPILRPFAGVSTGDLLGAAVAVPPVPAKRLSSAWTPTSGLQSATIGDRSYVPDWLAYEPPT